MTNFIRLNIPEAQELMNNPSLTIVDIRDIDSYNAAHIEDAKHVGDENITDFIQTTDHDKPLLCYCYRGHSSQSAAAYFIQQGFKEVYSLDGGFEGWRQETGA